MCSPRAVRTSLTRIVGGLNEQTEVALDEGLPFTTTRFTVSGGEQGWRIEPGPAQASALPLPTMTGVLLQGRVLSGPHPLQDDDLISAGLDHWIFHDGEVARDLEMEERALDEGGEAWAVLADWLEERGDPLGARISARLGTQTLQRSLVGEPGVDAFADVRGLEQWVTGDSQFRLECDERNGVVSRLIARSVSGMEDELAAVLRLRRMRFVEHLVLDAGAGGVETWVRHLEQWALPRWLKTITFGVEFGVEPAGWQPPHLPARFQERCPRIRIGPLVRWAGTARLELVQDAGAHVLKGMEPGESRLIQSGTTLQFLGNELLVGEGPAYGSLDRHYIFELVDSRWYLIASDLNQGGSAAQWYNTPKPITAAIAGWRVRRTPLLHDDLIELEPGLTFRFRLEA